MLGPLAVGAWNVSDDVENVRRTLTQIYAVMLDANKRQQISYSHEVNNYLENLNEVFYKVDDILDDVCTQHLAREVMTKHKNAKNLRIFFSTKNQIAFNFRMAPKLKKIRKRFDELKLGERVFNFSTRTADQQAMNQRITDPIISERLVIGREEMKNQLLGKLLNTEVETVIVIVGIGGLGKTALAQLAFSDPAVQEHFECKKWVCVADNFLGFNAKSITVKMAGGSTNDPALAKQNLKQQMDGLRCLIILDDVWSENSQGWDYFMEKEMSVKMAKGSKVMITTRSDDVAKVSHSTSILHLKSLDEEHSWALFSREAFRNDGPENQNLIPIGKDIVKKCAGVPLAINVIGNLMASMITEQEWLNVRNKDLPMIDGQSEEQIFQLLKLSYDYLSIDLQKCFAFCSLFWKDTHIYKNELIRLWIGNGFIMSSGANTSLDDVAEHYFWTLHRRSFFQDVQTDENGDIMFKMHDLMHDLACLIAKNEYAQMIDSGGPSNIDKQTRFISFGFAPEPSWQVPNNILKADQLRTFLLNNSSSLQESACKSIISSFKKFRVLRLSYLSIKKIPSCIGAQIHLRYLDVSNSDQIEVLPSSITKLYNLETLLLNGCHRLRELPKDIWKLTRLKHLEMMGCDSLCLPLGIGQLTTLQTVIPFVLSESEHSATTSELGTLNNLTKQLTVVGLKCLRRTPTDINHMNLMAKSRLERLNLKWSLQIDGDTNNNEGDDIMLQCMAVHPNTKILGICGFGSVKISSPINLFSHLNELHLESCLILQYLPDSVFNVKSLYLKELPSLEWLVHNDDSSTFSPSLKEIFLCSLPNLKGWCECNEEELAGGCHQFKSLDYLSISNCLNLISIPQHTKIRRVKLGDDIRPEFVQALSEQLF